MSASTSGASESDAAAMMMACMAKQAKRLRSESVVLAAGSFAFVSAFLLLGGRFVGNESKPLPTLSPLIFAIEGIIAQAGLRVSRIILGNYPFTSSNPPATLKA